MEGLLSSSIAPDLAILILLTSVFIIYGIMEGSGILVSTIIAAPIAGLLYLIFPYHAELLAVMPSGLAAWVPLLLFGIFIWFTLWIQHRTVGIARGSGRPFYVVVVSTLLALLLISFTYHIVPIDSLYSFSSTFDTLFESTTSLFWILIIALFALFVA
tara:strand:+ start:8013 stop:8486 length:474 start_codon:yes stop_codon:yes gene_type:complete